MDATHAALIAEGAVLADPQPVGLSLAPWCWHSGQKAEPFASKTTRGKKPNRKAAGKYGTASRRVLAVMTRLASRTGYAFPSVKTIMKEADCSRSTARRARDYLKQTGALIAAGHSGPEYRGTAIFMVPEMNPNVEVDVESNKNVCNTSAQDTLLYEHGEGHEAKPETATTQSVGATEQSSETPTVPSPNCAAPLPKPRKPWPVAVVDANHQRKLVEEALGKRDSKLGEAWKSALQKAGLVPSLTAIEGRQLRQLTRGKHALDYVEVRDQIIPNVGGNWQSFLCFWAHVKITNKSKSMSYDKPIRVAPFPAAPSTGFLLRHRKIARKFVQWVQRVQASDFPPDVKEHLWNELHDYYANTGPLPKTISAPTTPKRWNSPIWSQYHYKGKVDLELFPCPGTSVLVTKAYLKKQGMAQPQPTTMTLTTKTKVVTSAGAL